jgi:predicted TPR repeat methyltransferase
MPKPDLDNAYSLKTAEDARRLYADWAETYDTTFAQAMDFAVPTHVAEAYVAAGGGGPVLDFGCGTGLVGAVLARLGCGPVDGTDLSPEMLEVAGRKGVYRNLIAGDVFAGLDIADGEYAGVVSSGTFTHGHVGPDALDELLRVAAPGARFALSINGVHFAAAGFAGKFAALDGRITGLTLPEVRFYGDAATGAHKDDTGMIAMFRKV